MGDVEHSTVKRMKRKPSRLVCDKCGYGTSRTNDFLKHKFSLHSMCAKREIQMGIVSNGSPREINDQKSTNQRESSSEIRDLFQDLNSWSNERAESQKQLDNLLSKCTNDVLEEVRDLKGKHSLITKERDDLIETVIQQSGQISHLKDKLKIAQKLPEPEKIIRVQEDTQDIEAQNLDILKEELPDTKEHGERWVKESVQVNSYCEKEPEDEDAQTLKQDCNDVMPELANAPRESPVKSPEPKTDRETVILPRTGETIEKPQIHWAIGCAFRCLTCGMVNWGRHKIRDHMLAAHRMGWDGKTKRYEKIYNSMFTCQICNEEFPHELDRVHQHMKGKHNIAPKIYYNKYVIGQNAQNEVDPSHVNKLIDANVSETENILEQEEFAKDPLESANQDKTEALKKKMTRKPLLLRRSNASKLKLSCELCPYRANSQKVLKEHIKGQHASVRSYVCEKCGYATFQKSNLKQHKDYVHPMEEKIPCEQCPFQSELMGTMLTHVKNNHPRKESNLKHIHPVEEKRFQCEQCPYQTKLKGTLLTHFNKIHSRKESNLKQDRTGLCKRSVPSLKTPAPSAARQSDLPMHSPISQFRKVLAQFFQLGAISVARPCTTTIRPL